MSPHLRRLSDATGHARSEMAPQTAWYAGVARPPPTQSEEHESRWLPFGSGFGAMEEWRDAAISSEVREALVAVVDGQKSLTLRQMEVMRVESVAVHTTVKCRPGDREIGEV